MKIFLLIQISSLILFANEIEWIDKKIKMIQSMQKNSTNIELLSLKNPFIVPNVTNPNQKLIKFEFDEKLLLDAILNNSVLISSRWYRVGEWVNGYKIVKIDETSITLSKLKKIFIVVMATKKSIPLSRMKK